MTRITDLAQSDSLADGDLFAFFDQSAGNTRSIPAAAILDFVQAYLDSVHFGTFESLYSAPSATGFSVSVSPTANGGDVHLILTPTAGFADGTIVLPPIADVVDKQQVLVNCTQSVTTLTIDGNGATAVTGAPSTLSANGFFRLKYDSVLKTWYRVG